MRDDRAMPRIRMYGTGPDQLMLRVDGAAEKRLGLLPALRAADVPNTVRRRQTGGADWAEVLIAAVGSGGVLTVLAETLRAVLDRERKAEIRVETADGTTVVASGASVEDVERAIALALEARAAIERNESAG